MYHNHPLSCRPFIGKQSLTRQMSHTPTSCFNNEVRWDSLLGLYWPVHYYMCSSNESRKSFLWHREHHFPLRHLVSPKRNQNVVIGVLVFAIVIFRLSLLPFEAFLLDVTGFAKVHALRAVTTRTATTLSMLFPIPTSIERYVLGNRPVKLQSCCEANFCNRCKVANCCVVPSLAMTWNNDIPSPDFERSLKRSTIIVARSSKPVWASVDVGSTITSPYLAM